jgi:hypothetical protein
MITKPVVIEKCPCIQEMKKALPLEGHVLEIIFFLSWSYVGFLHLKIPLILPHIQG